MEDISEKYKNLIRVISGLKVYLLPAEYTDPERIEIAKDFFITDIISSYIEIINRYKDTSLYLGIADTERNNSAFRYLPVLCLYYNDEYCPVQYWKKRLHLQCRFNDPKGMAGSVENVLMPLFENDNDRAYYGRNSYNYVPDFFNQVKCPKCGQVIYGHYFALDDYNLSISQYPPCSSDTLP